MKLTDYQIEYLANKFFTHKDFAGSTEIGKALLKKGYCITTKQGEKMYYGGVGNYIKTETAPEYIDCIKLVLNFESFIKSSWVREALEFNSDLIHNEAQKLLQQSADLKVLLDFN